MKLKDIVTENQFETDIEHTLGNSLFAIEANIQSLKRRVINGKTEEALAIIADIELSIEKAKLGLDKWKNR